MGIGHASVNSQTEQFTPLVYQQILGTPLDSDDSDSLSSVLKIRKQFPQYRVFFNEKHIHQQVYDEWQKEQQTTKTPSQ